MPIDTPPSPQYERIVRLKPIIEADRELIKKMKGCFDYIAEYEYCEDTPLPPEFKTREYMFKGFNMFRREFGTFYVTDPKTNLTVYFNLRIMEKDAEETFNVNFAYLSDKDPLRNVKSLGAIIAELGTLENLGGYVESDLLGIVLDLRTNNSALLRADHSQGGRYRPTKVNSEGVIFVFDEDEKTERIQEYIRIDRLEFGLEGRKYANPEAMIEIR